MECCTQWCKITDTALPRVPAGNDNTNATAMAILSMVMYLLPLSTTNQMLPMDTTLSTFITMMEPAVEQHDSGGSQNTALSKVPTENDNTNATAMASLPAAEIFAENAAHLPDSSILAAADTPPAVIRTKFNILI